MEKATEREPIDADSASDALAFRTPKRKTRPVDSGTPGKEDEDVFFQSHRKARRTLSKAGSALEAAIQVLSNDQETLSTRLEFAAKLWTLTLSGKPDQYEMKEPAAKCDAYYRLYKEKDRVDFKKGIRHETLPPAIIPGSVINGIDEDGKLKMTTFLKSFIKKEL
ncbi:hypothetical protein ATCC90586_006028 [Pythium insidiosum]|nr:hypothetical protein ATCC90586_006028 [Pythium insidiosum]